MGSISLKMGNFSILAKVALPPVADHHIFQWGGGSVKTSVPSHGFELGSVLPNLIKLKGSCTKIVTILILY